HGGRSRGSSAAVLRPARRAGRRSRTAAGPRTVRPARPRRHRAAPPAPSGCPGRDRRPTRPRPRRAPSRRWSTLRWPRRSPAHPAPAREPVTAARAELRRVEIDVLLDPFSASWSDVRAGAGAAEAAGFGGVWVWDHLAGRVHGADRVLESWTVL